MAMYRRRTTALALVVSAVLAIFASTSLVGATTQRDGVAQQASTTTTTRRTAVDNVRPGRVAFTNEAGEVLVALSDGTDPLVVGRGAATNAIGLAPLAWDPFGASIAYVRTDGSLMLAPADGGEERVVATDAVVPPDATDQLLSFDVLGQTLSYVRQPAPGQYRAQVIGIATAEAVSAPIGDVDRIPLSIEWSPLDAFLLYVSASTSSAKDTYLAFAFPGGGSTRSSVQLVDPTFSPDGSVVYGILRAQGADQMVKIAIDDLKVAVMFERPHICHPSVSPGGDEVIFGSGDDDTCSEVWIAPTDGTKAKRLYRRVGSNVVFSAGAFSWSLDGSAVSHPSCRMLTEGPRCGTDGYWDLSPDGKDPVQRAGRNVRREVRPTLKSVKVRFDLTGPFTYERTMVVSAEAAGSVLNNERSTTIDFSSKDERNSSRSFSLTSVGVEGERYTAGTLTIKDPDRKVDREVSIMATAVITGYRFAAIRGIWLDTSVMPFTSGLLDIRITR